MTEETGSLLPKTYEIRVKSHLDDRRINQFEGFQATLLPHGETLLTGQVPDQSALYGILDLIRDLNIPLLEVRCHDDTDG